MGAYANEPSEKSKPKVPVSAIVAGMVAVAGVALTCLSIYPPEWLRTWLDPARVTAEHINSCMDRHELQTTPHKDIHEFTETETEQTGEFRRTIYSSCTWPATAVTEADGFTQITVTTVIGFGEGEASSATVFDRIQASCSTVELVYNRAGMGDFGPQPAVRLGRGTVAYAAEGKVVPYTGSWQTSSYDGHTVKYPDPSEIIVLHNGRRVLSSAECV
jgi:hypothetical protein